jgi:hypothetical protein
MKPAWIVSGLLFLGVAAFLLKFLIAPAPVEEHRTQPVGWVEDFPEGVTPSPGCGLSSSGKATPFIF